MARVADIEGNVGTTRAVYSGEASIEIELYLKAGRRRCPSCRGLVRFADARAEVSPVLNILRFEPLGEARGASDFHLNILARGD